ncbi:hypothetical protein JNUCC0626_48120 [Lentzea sp. JNUCC 0626]
MTIAGAIITSFVIPMLAGQLIYALSRGKPTPVQVHAHSRGNEELDLD